MANDMNISTTSIPEIVDEAIRRETALESFYRQVIRGLGPDASPVLKRLYIQHGERIAQLESLVSEMQELQDLTGPIAD